MSRHEASMAARAGTAAGAGTALRSRCRRWRLARAVLAATLLVPFASAVALAHPLGNFTINHYAGIRVEPSRVLLDVVIDEAEIPTFQATGELDADGDGSVSPGELAAARGPRCLAVGSALSLTVDGRAASLRLIGAGLSLPPGNAGLPTMRLVCTFEAPLTARLAAGTTLSFADAFEPSRIGWREIEVAGDGVTVTLPDGGTAASDASNRLTRYLTGLTGAPDERAVSFTASPGGAALAPLVVADAAPIGPLAVTAGSTPGSATGGGSTSTAPATASSASASSASASSTSANVASSGAVPGGEGSIPDVLRSTPVTPAIALLALLTAAVLGAGHAITPGHGKTLMAAYLVGTRGTPRHALGLGLAVSVSHTLGILGLSLVVVGAESALPPDLVVRLAPLVAAASIVLIGGWMLATEIRRAVARRADRRHGADAHEHPHDHGHDHDRAPTNEALEHSHGGVRHRHGPRPGSTITWRSLFVLGLAGGLVPSTNALLILLATIAAGRPWWGVVLVAAFGLGMAAVMAGVGLLFVHARGLLDRAPGRTSLGCVARLVPAGAAVLVLGVGLVLAGQAVGTARLG